MEALTNFFAKALGPIFRPVSWWLVSERRTRPTWHYETAFVALVLISVAALTSPAISELSDMLVLKEFLIIWISVGAVLGSFLHAKVGYRMSEAMEANKVSSVYCYEWAGRYWVSK